MSTYILMKILESAPNRYDRGIRILTLGRLTKIYDRLTSYINKRQNVLDIGCGTGALTVRAALKGAKVKGIDINPQMLEIAQMRVNKANLKKNIKLCEMGVAEIGNEKADSYNAVMSSLCFSELTRDELNYALKEIKRILSPGGLLLIADEAVPKNPFKRVGNWLIRFPLMMITYIFTQTATRAIRDLPHKIIGAGFIIESIRLSWMENFVEIVAKKPKGIIK
jgi:ubiquinone/menaquinone biosynthesis C-methylase UbiE